MCYLTSLKEPFNIGKQSRVIHSGPRGRKISGFEASLVYIVSFNSAKSTKKKKIITRGEGSDSQEGVE